MLKGQLIDPVFWKSGIEKLLISLALEIVAPFEGRFRHMRRMVPQLPELPLDWRARRFWDGYRKMG